MDKKSYEWGYMKQLRKLETQVLRLTKLNLSTRTIALFLDLSQERILTIQKRVLRG